ncbi:hypothetical protein ACFYYR_17850 [Streptomyces sp. NPDC001922]|uniref:hypothetical protein n=1 Tax=Streptomyces sp. NPDC001922 TaxID=3364624 RepID=UPI0036ACAEC3
MLSLPVTLAARLLPVAVLAAAGWGLTGDPSGATRPTASSDTAPSLKSAAAPGFDKPPAPCGALSAKTVEKLVPGAGANGSEIRSTDARRRSGCSWHALQGYDYRWLDVAYEVSPAGERARTAGAVYGGHRQPTAVPDLGEEASVGTKVTEEDGQPTRRTVVAVRAKNAVVTVTYNGSNFENSTAPSSGTMREGALTAAREAVAELAGVGS